MSGHSKFHNIAKKKGAADSNRAAVFAKFAKTIAVAARAGGSDPSFNFQLRVAVDQAKEVNMPKENILRAIKKGSGEDGGEAIEEVIYEGFGPAGSAILVKCLTDNRNRSVAEVKNAAAKNGGIIGAQGSVMWMFEKKGIVTIADVSQIKDRDTFDLAVIEAGADDIIAEEEYLEVLSAPDQLKKVLDAIESQTLKVDGAEMEYRAKELVTLSSAEDIAQFEKLMIALDDLEDVDTVYTNVK